MLKFDKPSRAVEVAGYVESLIEEKALVPGQRITTKDDLRCTIGVARATINEAIKLLHDRGRIVMRPGPGGGIFVAETDPVVRLGRSLLAVGTSANSVGDAIALREFLETLILEEAVRHKDDTDIVELRQCLAQLRDNRDDPLMFIKTVWELHNRIASITPNLFLKATYFGLVNFISNEVKEVSRAPEPTVVEYFEHRIKVHAELVDVIESGDATRVEAAIIAHHPDMGLGPPCRGLSVAICGNRADIHRK